MDDMTSQQGEDADVADTRQENPNDEAAVHTTHEGQWTDMSDFMDQVLTRTAELKRAKITAHDKKRSCTVGQTRPQPSQRDHNEAR